MMVDSFLFTTLVNNLTLDWLEEVKAESEERKTLLVTRTTGNSEPYVRLI